MWESVTPVILHGYNSNRVRFFAETEILLLEAFEHAEYLERLIEAVVFEPAPLWPGVVGGGADESASAVEQLSGVSGAGGVSGGV